MVPLRRRKPCVLCRHGVTVLESMLSVAIVTIAGAALLSALGSAVRTSREISLTTIAEGLAQQLLCEVAAAPVPVGTTPAKPAAPRVNFSVVDHFDGWDESPPQDRFARPLGTEGNSVGTPRPAALQGDAKLLLRFRRTVAVEKVAFSGGNWIPTTADSVLRRITVRVFFEDEGRSRPLAEVSQIISHVSPAL